MSKIHSDNEYIQAAMFEAEAKPEGNQERINRINNQRAMYREHLLKSYGARGYTQDEILEAFEPFWREA